MILQILIGENIQVMKIPAGNLHIITGLHGHGFFLLFVRHGVWFMAQREKTALAWLSSSVLNINKGCAGHVPKIADGDFPHTPRGCDAQARGVSKLLRVWKINSS